MDRAAEARNTLAEYLDTAIAAGTADLADLEALLESAPGQIADLRRTLGELERMRKQIMTGGT